MLPVLLASTAAAEPWRLQDQGLPGWLKIWGEERYRLEVMDNTFRAIDPGFDRMTTSRLLLAAEASGEHWFVGAELQDSRAWWHDDRTPLGTADVNAGEFLQAYMGVRGKSVLAEGDELAFYAGRMTLDMGASRIVARNGYRNTINGFAGARLAWKGAGGSRVQAFYTLPMERLPDNTDRDALRDNEIQNDKSTRDRVLWGVELARYAIDEERLGDLYLVGFREDDRPSLPARERDHLTVGGRFYDETGPWQGEVELAYQWGDAVALPPATPGTLDIEAWLLHLEVSHVFDGPSALRLYAKYDFASGDSDPTDNKLERFDTLFAARRRDFGLLGIYGPFFFSNISSPAVGLKMRVSPSLRFETSYRPAWLAEKRDFFVGSGIRDREGQSGDFIGHQFDARFDWEVIPRQLTLMFGAAWLNKGEFLKDAPLAPDNGDTIYGVTQFILRF
ncbi:MAG: alginate export family protein [Halieaceae bacterium]|jgi:hypothetical protein|nr:alginate export family protein [Halieaceae bacterium]